MIKKSQSTTSKQKMKDTKKSTTSKIMIFLVPFITIATILGIWQILYMIEVVPQYMLPSPIGVWEAFLADFPLLMEHTKTTMLEAFVGLGIGVGLGFILATIMEANRWVHKSIYPLLVISQTVPTVAIAPLLVLWMGYGIAPKIALIVIVTFFPIAIGLLDGFKAADSDSINLMKAMGAKKYQIFFHIKLPSSLNNFFAGLRISVSYSIVGAVIAEWLGGYQGLGVYMTRVKKSFSYDKMFTVIFLISIVSLILICGVKILQKSIMKWEQVKENGSEL